MRIGLQGVWDLLNFNIFILKRTNSQDTGVTTIENKDRLRMSKKFWVEVER